MLFNSIDFAIFLPIVFIIYWFAVNKNLRLQNLFITTASYFFYGWWDWRFLSLLLISTGIDFVAGLGLQAQRYQYKRKFLLWTCICINLGMLGFFKYYNFFIENFTDAFSLFGKEIEGRTLNIVLPVGISFYTFQSMSYVLDIYRGKIQPTRDLVAYSAFVSFFPQLVAGPIERASHLLPQFFSRKIFDYSKAVDGMRQILSGLFKKIVIADGCALYANMIFNNSDQYSGSTLALGALFFTFQIYGDFSGYSDIAIGTARLFGFELMQNFNFPYFSRNCAEFWKRWHISLSTWFRDYVYIPLGGSRGSKVHIIRNTLIVFIVSGFWHGANWTFIAWGALNAVYVLPYMLNKRKHSPRIADVGEEQLTSTWRELLSIGVTFTLTVIAWIFFRANTLQHASRILGEIFSASLFTMPQVYSLSLMALISVFLLSEWVGRYRPYALERLFTIQSRPLRLASYYFLAFMIFYSAGRPQQFIYFQF